MAKKIRGYFLPHIVITATGAADAIAPPPSFSTSNNNVLNLLHLFLLKMLQNLTREHWVQRITFAAETDVAYCSVQSRLGIAA